MKIEFKDSTEFDKFLKFLERREQKLSKKTYSRSIRYNERKVKEYAK